MYLHNENKSSPEFRISTVIVFGVSFKQNNTCSNLSETIRSGVEDYFNASIIGRLLLLHETPTGK
jgi:hypothetical protein